jgi:hypothetical protein
VVTDASERQRLMSSPRVGRIVHYVSSGALKGEYQRECRAAVVTTVGAWITTGMDVAEDEQSRVLTQERNPTALGLHVINPRGMFFTEEVPHDPGYPETEDSAMCDGQCHSPGSWHWPDDKEES